MKTLHLGRVERYWFDYLDKNGRGFAEPDGLIIYPSRVLIIESKLTGNVHGKMQLEGLYRPLVEAHYQRPAVCLLVCKWVNGSTPGPFVASPEAFLALGTRFGTWQWLP